MLARHQKHTKHDSEENPLVMCTMLMWGRNPCTDHLLQNLQTHQWLGCIACCDVYRREDVCTTTTKFWRLHHRDKFESMYITRNIISSSASTQNTDFFAPQNKRMDVLKNSTVTMILSIPRWYWCFLITIRKESLSISILQASPRILTYHHIQIAKILFTQCSNIHSKKVPNSDLESFCHHNTCIQTRLPIDVLEIHCHNQPTSLCLSATL